MATDSGDRIWNGYVLQASTIKESSTTNSGEGVRQVDIHQPCTTHKCPIDNSDRIRDVYARQPCTTLKCTTVYGIDRSGNVHISETRTAPKCTQVNVSD